MAPDTTTKPFTKTGKRWIMSEKHRSYLWFDIGGPAPTIWRRILAFLRIRSLPPRGIPDDAVITSAALTIWWSDSDA